MAAKVILMGRPGSGKSHTARHIEQAASGLGLSFLHTGDYHILYQMYQADTACRRFEAADPSRPQLGFTVKDPSVFAEAMDKLIDLIEREAPNKDLLIVEFARNEYKSVFSDIPPVLYKDSFIIYFESELQTCIRRIQDRISNIQTAADYRGALEKVVDNHLISPTYMLENFSQDNFEYMADPTGFAADFGIDPQRLLALRNNGQGEEVSAGLTDFIGRVLEDAAQV